MSVLHEMNQQLAKENAHLLVEVSKKHSAAHYEALSSATGTSKKEDESVCGELSTT